MNSIDTLIPAPQTCSNENATQTVTRPDGRIKTGKRRILAVDDQASNTRLVKLYLERTDNYVVREVNNPNAALSVAEEFQPHLILLDEPTAGLDVPARVELHELMRQLQSDGTTIILATHDMAEAEKMSSRVAILLKGKIAATGTPTQLTAEGGGLVKISVASETSCLAQNGHGFPGVRQHRFEEGYALYFSDDPGPTVSSILDYLKSHQDRLADLRVERPSLEERFLEITQTNGGLK